MKEEKQVEMKKWFHGDITELQAWNTLADPQQYIVGQERERG